MNKGKLARQKQKGAGPKEGGPKHLKSPTEENTQKEALSDWDSYMGVPAGVTRDIPRQGARLKVLNFILQL